MVTATSQKIKLMGILLWLCTLLMGAFLPIFMLVPSLIFCVMKKEDFYIMAQGKEALNFSITVSIVYGIIFFMTIFLKNDILMPAVYLVLLISLIVNTIGLVYAIKGKVFRIPFGLKLIK